jgi:hypothetical protein
MPGCLISQTSRLALRQGEYFGERGRFRRRIEGSEFASVIMATAPVLFVAVDGMPHDSGRRRRSSDIDRCVCAEFVACGCR